MVSLEPMDEAFFNQYIRESLANFAEEMTTAGIWNLEEVDKKSQEKMQNLLPQGMEAPGHDFFRVVDKELDESVGILWIQVKDMAGERAFFIFDIEIDELFRRRGYGRRTLSALEEKAANLNVRAILLNVFADNVIARRLYDKSGFVVIKTQTNEHGKIVSYLMMKKINGSIEKTI